MRHNAIAPQLTQVALTQVCARAITCMRHISTNNTFYTYTNILTDIVYSYVTSQLETAKHPKLIIVIRILDTDHPQN